MKSLDIVNERMIQIDKGKKDFNEIKSYINHLTYEEFQQIKQDLERLEKLEEERKLLVSGKMILVSTSVIDRIHKMQQDLEVLEIIKNKKVDVESFKRWVNFEKINSSADFSYNALVKPDRRLTLEEIIKLKQWLEGDE